MIDHAPCALITGASSGIGKAYAEHLARTGHDLVIIARRTDRLSKLAQILEAEHGIAVEIMTADLTQPSDVLRVANRLEAGPSIDLFVNNAGYAARGKVAELDLDAFEAMLQVNILAMSRLSHSALGQMLKKGSGSIINISSATAFILLPGNAGYGASKSFVMAFTRHMQLEAEGTDIRVQLLIPGVIDTDFHEVAGSNVSNFPSERVMKPDDLVVASLRALAMNEPVCIPSMPEVSDWEAYVKAEKAVAANVSRDHTASRYHEA